MADQETSSPFEDSNILTLLTDPWDAQSQIFVFRENGKLSFYKGLGEEFERLDEAPDPATVYVRPSRRSLEYENIERVENIIARAIAKSGGNIKLDKALMLLLRDGGIDAADAEGILRYLVGRGDFPVTVSGKNQTVKFSLSEIARSRENHRAYASSFAHELAMQAEQIGRLIGHGPTIGSEREELLRALIERHVPQRFHVATGFVEGSDRQVDILIYDQIDFAPLFRSGNLVVVPIEAVRGLIEVKSMLTSGALLDALGHLDLAVGNQTSGPPVFRGVFGYKGAKAKTLIDTIVAHHQDPEGPDDETHPVLSIYDMADAICVLRSTILLTDFIPGANREDGRPTPGVAELTSEAGRDTQAAIFFDRLLRVLRHPFDGPVKQQGFGTRFDMDVERRTFEEFYPNRNWGPYFINDGIEKMEAQVEARRAWLSGGEWQEPL